MADPERRLHTPGGKHTTLSKIHGAWVISQHYSHTRMNDDHWPTINQGAHVLQDLDVEFRYIYHGFPAIYPSEEYLADHPKVTVLDLTRRH